MAAKQPAQQPAYEVIVGLNYPPGRRVEPGEIVNDVPPESIEWLLAQGAIKLAMPTLGAGEEVERGV